MATSYSRIVKLLFKRNITKTKSKTCILFDGERKFRFTVMQYETPFEKNSFNIVYNIIIYNQ